MSRHVVAFIAILVLGTLGIVAYKFALPGVMEAWQRRTSDAAAVHGELRIGVDGWVGYFPLCSSEMRRRMRARGYALSCNNDGGDYPKRFQALEAGELELAVGTVDAYVLNGAKLDYPATIVAVLDESKGGDAIVARRSKVANLEALKRSPPARIAFTPSSPSEHLLKSIGAHFDLPHARAPRDSWQVAANGSPDALKKLQGGEVDVAVLWEPDVSRALADADFVKLIGTEDTEALIVDVLLASRSVVEHKPEAVAVLLEEYFLTLAHYRADPAALREEVAKYAEVDDDQVEPMLGGVAWADLAENGERWFGVEPAASGGREALIDTITGTADILIEAGDFSSNPLPGSDPYRLTNSQFIATAYKAGAPGGAHAAQAEDFAPLDSAGWATLREVGALRIEPIGFARGTGSIDESGAEAVAGVARTLAHYPHYRLAIRGHTGVGGDDDANLELSQVRARAVMEMLSTQYGIDPDRMQGEGYGSSRPLPRAPGESDRSYAYRLPRVEFVLLAGAH
jgi:outer membrane protein OmpA-like peptidoglycan-associated protein/ABC-type taurine transport system substrate-binding protein